MVLRWLVASTLVGMAAACGLLVVQGRLVVADPAAAAAEAPSVDVGPGSLPGPAPTSGSRTELAPSPTPLPEPPPPVAVVEPGTLLIGDSILEGLRLLDRGFGPGTVYDTEVSRSILDLPDRLDRHREAGHLPDRIVIHLGTNGWSSEADTLLDRQVSELEGHRVVLVDVAVDRPWAAAANRSIHAIAARHDHVRLVGWQQAVGPALLRSDLVHPNGAGFDVLARLIGAAVGVPPAGPSPLVR